MRMAGQRTVFVLGAAANKEIDHTKNMPVGSELALRIQQSLAGELNSGTGWPNGPISDAISRQLGGVTDQHILAMRRIERGITFKESIDEFIDEWQDVPRLVECGKLAICHEILKAEANTLYPGLLRDEHGSSIAFRSIRDSWLGQIFRFANPKARRRDVKQCLEGISFITFNYDRCLEAALYSFIRHGQNIDEAEAVELFQSVPVIHAYGSLGMISVPGVSGLEIGSTEPWSISRGASSIRTFTEEFKSENKEEMSFHLFHADRIVFLGFGFHQRNLDLILPKSLSSRSHVLATGVGLRPEQRDEIQKRMFHLGKEIKIFPVQCSELVDAHRQTIFGPWE
jgi:hypothetical protein